MMTEHSETVQKWAQGLLELGRTVISFPQVHAGCHWHIQNHLRFHDHGTPGYEAIHISFGYEGKWESDLPFPEPIQGQDYCQRLQEAFTEHESGLEGLTGVASWDIWTAPKKVYKVKGRGGHWEPVGHFLIGAYGGKEYVVPFSDLPSEIQEEYERLGDRHDKISNLEQVINGSRAYFHNLTPAALESTEITKELQEELARLLESHKVAKKVTPSTYKEALRQYQNHVLAYLGLPTDAPEPEGGVQGIPSDKPLTLARWLSI